MSTFFVNRTSGNDSNSGTSGSPVASLTKAFTLVKARADAGDHGVHEIIIQDGGTYQEGALGFEPLFSAQTQVTIMALTGSDGRPVASPIIRGSGSAGVQSYAFYSGRKWTFRGLTFENWIITENRAIIFGRDGGITAADQFATIEDCTFRDVTGSCISLTEGSGDPGLHVIQRNKFYRINAPSSSTIAISILNPNKVKLVNNVFYDIEFGHVNSKLINAAGTRQPANIISHNTFGTSSCPQLAKPNVVVDANYSKFEYNIMNGYDAGNSFADIRYGEANYNLYYNITGSSSNRPFGEAAGGPTASANNITGNDANALFIGPLAGTNDTNYRLAGTNSPAFDAAVGSSDVSRDHTGGARTTLDITALGTGIFDIGAYELTGLWVVEKPDSLPQYGGDFVINRIENSNNQYKRASSTGNTTLYGHDVDQVPYSVAQNGAIPSFIRKNPASYVIKTGKKGGTE
tara:strand:+ start:247 stop:1629 length:1383 start_codon:yes stop_codon:yes gene_type:complete